MTTPDPSERRPYTVAELQTRRAHARRIRRRRRWAALIGFTSACIVLFGVLLDAGASRTSQSISTRTEGQKPTKSTASRSTTTVSRRTAEHRAKVVKRHPHPERAVHRVLRYTSYVRLAGARRRDVALTFDDGPSPYTSQIIAILRRTHTPATFFVIGRSASLYRRLVRTEASDGFDVGDHTETHAFLSQLSGAEQADQISQAADAIRAAHAPTPDLFRPPYGAFNATTLATLRAKHLLMVLWSVDTSDYSRPGAAKIVSTAISGAQPGAIILMHDGGGDRSETVAALPKIITRLRQRHFRFVTVSQLVADDPPPRGQPAPQPLSGIG